MVFCYFSIFFVFNKDKELPFCCQPFLFVSNQCCKEYSRHSEFFLNTGILKIGKFWKMTCCNFIFFVFIIINWCLAFKIVVVALYCIRRYCFFIFFTKPQVLLFYLFFFCSQVFQVYLYCCSIIFWTKYIFSKVTDSIYDWWIIYPNFAS